jgi:hypothetical protein
VSQLVAEERVLGIHLSRLGRYSHRKMVVFVAIVRTTRPSQGCCRKFEETQPDQAWALGHLFLPR